MYLGTLNCAYQHDHIVFVGNCFRKQEVHIFEPKKLEHIDIILQWLEQEVTSFESDSRLWLGWAVLRRPNGTGLDSGAFRSIRQRPLPLYQPNSTTWADREPDNEEKELCTQTIKGKKMFNTPCVHDVAAYAVCEVTNKHDFNKLSKK